MAQLPARRMSGIEALRGIAASFVVMYHVARHLRQTGGADWLIKPLQFGHAGVDIFFVLSGFIILFVHGNDIGQPARWTKYIYKRFQRVMPIYWIALAVTVMLTTFSGHAFPPLGRVMISAALVPSHDTPLLSIAWTLVFEIMFYAVFSVLILSRRAGAMLFVIWLSGICLKWAGLTLLQNSIIPPALFDSFNLEFFLGLSAAFYVKRKTVRRPAVFAGVGVLLFALSATLEDSGLLHGFAPIARLAYGVPTMLLIIGIVQLQQAGKLSVPPWLSRLGSGSYPIYLFQFVFIGVTWKIWSEVGLDRNAPVAVSFCVLLGAAIPGGLSVSHFVEKPLLQRMGQLRAHPILAV